MDPNTAHARTGSQSSSHAPVDVYEVVYRKGEHLWRFRYLGGQEAHMIEAARDIMRKSRGLDWVDLALIAHEIRSGTAVDIVRKKDGNP